MYTFISFTMTDGKRVSFNPDNISAITECEGEETLIEVQSGKDFWVNESFKAVVQRIDSARGRGGR